MDELSSKVISLTSNSASFEAQINNFVICSLQFDEPLFNRTYESLRKDYSLSFVYENVFIPTLRRIGALWSSGELFPAQEHFLSNLIKQKFYNAIESVDPPVRKNKKAYLFLPPWEDHDFALLYSNMILKENGFDIVNVGKTISFESILQWTCSGNRNIVVEFKVINNRDEFNNFKNEYYPDRWFAHRKTLLKDKMKKAQSRAKKQIQLRHPSNHRV